MYVQLWFGVAVPKEDLLKVIRQKAEMMEMFQAVTVKISKDDDCKVKDDDEECETEDGETKDSDNCDTVTTNAEGLENATEKSNKRKKMTDPEKHEDNIRLKQKYQSVSREFIKSSDVDSKKAEYCENSRAKLKFEDCNLEDYDEIISNTKTIQDNSILEEFGWSSVSLRDPIVDDTEPGDSEIIFLIDKYSVTTQETLNGVYGINNSKMHSQHDELDLAIDYFKIEDTPQWFIAMVNEI